MLRIKKILCIILSLILSSCIFTSCKSAYTSGASKNNIPQELTIAYGLDTDAKSEKGTGDMLLKIFSGDRLVELEGTEVKPSLASSWEVKDDGKTIIFHLKKDIKFSDGTPLTADAVKFTYDRLFKFNSNQWTEIDRIKEVEVIDDNTVAFHIKDGQQGYIILTSFAEYACSIISPNSTKIKGDSSAPLENFIGTGPWKVSDYKKDQYTEFVPNTYYYDKKPTLTKVTVKDIPKAESRVTAIQSGDVDVIADYYHGGSQYTPRNLMKNLKDQGFQVLKKELPMTVVVAFNYKKTPWNNVKVRQAVNYAINKDDIVTLFDGWITPAKDKMFSEAAPYIKDSGEHEYAFDVNQAKTLLKDSGVVENYKVNLIAQGQNPDEVKMCELIKSQLSSVGLNVQMDTLESGVYSDRQKKGDWDMRIYYIGGPDRRKFTRLDGRFNPNSSEFAAYGAIGYYDSPEITAVLAKAVNSFDVKEQKENFEKFYNIAKDEAAGVPLYYESVFVIAKPEVKNIQYISSEPRFENVIIEKK